MFCWQQIDGTALLASLITIWSKAEESCPHVTVATHFHDLIRQRLISNSSRIRCKVNQQLLFFLFELSHIHCSLLCQTMETMNDDDGKLVYLYRVIDGLSTRSHAFSAALTVGLPEDVIRRANEVLISCSFAHLYFLLLFCSYWNESKLINHSIQYETLPIWKSKKKHRILVIVQLTDHMWFSFLEWSI